MYFFTFKLTTAKCGMTSDITFNNVGFDELIPQIKNWETNPNIAVELLDSDHPDVNYFKDCVCGQEAYP